MAGRGGLTLGHRQQSGASLDRRAIGFANATAAMRLLRYNCRGQTRIGLRILFCSQRSQCMAQIAYMRRHIS
jgi:hypothetical protein